MELCRVCNLIRSLIWVRDCPPKHMPTPALIRKNKDWNSAGLEEKQEEPGQKWLQRRAQKRKMSRKELNVMKLSLVFVRLQTEHMSRCQCASCKNNSLFIHTRVGRQLCSYITWGGACDVCVSIIHNYDMCVFNCLSPRTVSVPCLVLNSAMSITFFFIWQEKSRQHCRLRICRKFGFVSSEGALYVILPYDYPAAAAATFWTHTGP